MGFHELAAHLKANYDVVNTLYKQGLFEEEVNTTDVIADTNNFYTVSEDILDIKQRFSSGEPELLGKMRSPKDLQWAVRNLRDLAQYLYESYQSGADLTSDDIKIIIPYYFRSISLSYEVDDYFLSVSDETSKFLIDLAERSTRNIEEFSAQFQPYFVIGAEEYQELLKQILIVSLCGVNEYYRKHKYSDGLRLAKIVKLLLVELPRKLTNLKRHWFGLKGLCSYVTGKILTAQGNFSDGEQEFLNSVEAYSESIWQKERSFFRRQENLREIEGRFRKGEIDQEEYDRASEQFQMHKRNHELSRAVALRRSGLASSFGYGFQALVIGKVKDAIRLSSLSRGIVNWNTGKIYSSYVDLIYYSAKRAENSSDRKVLIEIQRNLKRCYRVFEALIPRAHYKYRALFQISLVYHYLARWYKEKGLALPEKSLDTEKRRKTRKWHFEKAQSYWNYAAKELSRTIEDERIQANKRLRAESMAILGHALSNLGLIEKELGGDGLELLEQADEILNKAWDEADELSQIKCEVGLAKAAVGKAKADYLLSASNSKYLDETHDRNPTPRDEVVRDSIRTILNNSRRMLNEVIVLNQKNSLRVQATAYLRLAELALLQQEAWSQARDYYDEYIKISSQVEHDFCHRWARELYKKVSQSSSFTLTIIPGQRFTKQEMDEKLEKYYCDYAVNFAAKKIEEDFAEDNITERDSLSSYLTSALHENFGIASTTASKWIKEYNMFAHLRHICYSASQLRAYARQSKKGKKKNTGA